MSEHVVMIEIGPLSCSEDGLRELIETIQARIADPKGTRKTVADVYSLLISLNNAQREQVPWATIHNSIIARWSFSALQFIKKQAWNDLRPRFRVPDAEREGRP